MGKGVLVLFYESNNAFSVFRLNVLDFTEFQISILKFLNIMFTLFNFCIKVGKNKPLNPKRIIIVENKRFRVFVTVKFF